MSDPCSMCIYLIRTYRHHRHYRVQRTPDIPRRPEPGEDNKVACRECRVGSHLSCSVQLYSRHLALVLACCCSWNDAPLQLSTKDNVIYDAPMSSAPRTLNA